MPYLDLHKIFIKEPKLSVGDTAYFIGDPTERTVTDIRCNITVYPDGAASISDWSYYLSDPEGGCGPLHEYEVATIQPEPRIEPKLGKVKSRAGYVYLLKEVNGSHYKIGRTVNPEDRGKTFGVQLPFRVRYDALIQTDDMIGLEAELHALFASKNTNGEWFALEPADVEYIKSLAVQS